MRETFAQTLMAFNSGATFSLLNASGSSQGLVQLQAREGLTGKGQLLTSLPQVSSGELLREETRVIPKDFPLVIGIDPSSSLKLGKTLGN